MKSRVESVVISVIVLLILVPVMSFIFADSYFISAAAPPATSTPQSKFTPSNPTIPAGPSATSQSVPATPVPVHTQVPPTVPPPTVPPPGSTSTPAPTPTSPSGATVTSTRPPAGQTPTATATITVPVRIVVAATPVCIVNTAVISGTKQTASAQVCPGGSNPLVITKTVELASGKFASKVNVDMTDSGICSVVKMPVGIENKSDFDVFANHGFLIDDDVSKFKYWGFIPHNIADDDVVEAIKYDPVTKHITIKIMPGVTFPAKDWVGAYLIFHFGAGCL